MRVGDGKLWLMVLTLGAVVTLVPAMLHSETQGRTAISKKAGSLKIGMTRQAVIALLGPATWASIPGDKGDFELPDPSFSLQLRWPSPGCFPVVANFDQSGKLNGWDEGRVCIKDADKFVPSAEYSCAKKDRSRLCGK